MKQNKKEQPVTKNQKKTFNKKIWREKKYSKKHKLQEWEENRRKAVIRNYYKDLKKETSPESRTALLKDAKNRLGKMSINKSAFQLAKEEYEKIKKNKEERRQEIERQKAERKQAYINNQAKRKEQMKKLSKKTKKGQPVMKERLEILLEKIQKNSNK